MVRLITQHGQLIDWNDEKLYPFPDNLVFLDLLKADPVVRPALTDVELEGLFDIGHHTKHVDTIFQRVFGRT